MSNNNVITKFVCTPTAVGVHQEQVGMVKDKVPAGVYRVALSRAGFYLKVVGDSFELPTKLYGTNEMPIQQIMDAYENSPKQMGVLLAGTKGAGKTLLSQILCNRMIKEKGMPVVLVDEAYADQQFFDFINQLGEVVVVFDEFAKVYGDEQKRMLTFFDGANVESKRMSIVIENGIKTVSDFMIDRPSRFLFRLTYDKLSDAVIREMCEDFNLDKVRTRDVMSYAGGVYNLSTDMLKALLTFITSFDKSVEEGLKLLNLPEVFGFRATAATPVRIKAIVDIQTGDKDKVVFTDQEATMTEYNFNLRRISNRNLESLENDLNAHIENHEIHIKEMAENGEVVKPLTEDQIEKRRDMLLRRYSTNYTISIKDCNTVKRFRPDTNDYLIGSTDDGIAVVYEVKEVIDIEAILQTL